VQVPAYDRDRVAIGAVHFGPGAFHRAHQACYLDEALAADPRWGIAAISLARLGERAVDPLADQLLQIGAACSGEAAHDVRLFLGLDRMFPAALTTHAGFVQALTESYAQLLQQVRQP
jgi:mannitol-1-phosphate/altronate dehydrogenase